MSRTPVHIFHNSLMKRLGLRCLSSSHLRRQEVVMNVFDRKAKLLQKNRALLAENPVIYDYLKDEVGARLADRIFDINRKFPRVVEIGCGRGHVSKHVIEDCVDVLVMCDSSQLALDQAALPEQGVRVEKVVIDEENLPFEDNSVDLVVSSLALHWVNNLPATFSQVIKSLKPDCAFLGSVFGGDTLYELRSSLQLAETERVGGISGHVSPFTDVRDIGGLLTQAGFTLLTIDSDEIVVGYPSMFELMWDLKGMAENNCAWNRSLHMRRDVLLAAASIYQDMYGSEDRVPATFQVLYFVAWKPDPSQPKPAKRGSATRSFKDLNSVK